MTLGRNATQEADLRHKQIVEARSGSCALSLDGLITWSSEGEHPLFDRSEAPIAGLPFEQRWPERDREKIARAVAAALQKGEGRFSAPSAHSGEWLDAIVHLRRDANREPVELFVTLTTCSDGGTAVHDYMMLFNAAPVAMWTAHDPDAAFILGNPISERRYRFRSGMNQSLSPGGSADLPNNYRIYRNGHEIPAHDLPMQRAAKGEEVLDEDYEIRLQDGTINHVILNASPMYNARGDIVGCVCVDIDITERKRIETMQRRFLECSRATGKAFFEALVRAIAETLGACHVYIAELVPEDRRVVRSMAAWANGKPEGLDDFIPVNTPCVDVLRNGEYKVVRHSLRDLYPTARAVQEVNAEAYVGTPLHGKDGQVIGIIGVMFDHAIDDALRPVDAVEIFAGRAAAEIQRLRVEESLRQSENEYRIITDAIPALITFLDTDARYRFSNAAMKSWFGVEPKDIKGKHISEVVGQAAFEQLQGYINLALQGHRQKFEAFLPYSTVAARHISGEYVPHIEDGRVRGFFALITDISDQKAGAEALRKSEAQFRTLFEHLPVGAALVDCSGAVQLENDVFATLLPPVETDAAVQSAVFTRACTLHSGDGTEIHPSRHPVLRALLGHVSRDVELLCRHAAGREGWVRMTGIPIKDEAGAVTGALVVVADIQGEKRHEERRTLLINELNHRVKNTLASVQSIAAQTFRASSLTADGLEAFEERLLALSNAHNLLTQEHWEGADLKRLSALVLEPHDPGSNRLRTHGPSVRLKPPAALAFAMALHELATNAVKYGAFSTSEGRAELNWHVSTTTTGRRLRVLWVETGGPPIDQPVTRKGFGTRLIERALAFGLGSETSIRYLRSGVVCEIDADLSEISS